MRQKEKYRTIVFLACIMFVCVCFAISFLSPIGKTITADAVTNRNMSFTTQELVYNSGTNNRTVNENNFASGDPYITSNGTNLYTGTTVHTVANVLHCPSTATNKDYYSVVFNANNVYRRWGGNSVLRYRLVLNNEVVYPVNGDWVNLGSTGGNTSEYAITCTVNMSAGDDLYFIVDDAAAANSGSCVFFAMGCRIDGTWFDCTLVDHINSTNDSKETDQYFGGTFVYSELFTYEAVLSWVDYDESSESTQFTDLQKRSAGSNVTFSSGNVESKRQWTPNTIDMRGAEYYAFNVDNSAGTQALDFAIVCYEGQNSSNLGCEWTFAEGNEYYLKKSNVIQKWKAERYDNTNRGLINIPVGFSGQVILPLENFEIYSWLLSSNSGRAARISKFSNARIMDLQYALFSDLVLFTTITESVAVTDFYWLGSDLVTGWVSDDHTTAIKAIDNIGDITAASESQIVKARTIYNRLSSTEKELVTNYATLTAATTAFKSLSGYSSIVGTDGKDFTNHAGLTLSNITTSPATISAWIKVGRGVEDKTHIGTILGNTSRVVSNNQEKDSDEIFSVEITSNGNPRLVWRKSATDKATFTVYNVDVRTGSWLNLAFVRDSENGLLYCYINGEKVSEKQTFKENLADISINSGNYLKIGSDYTSAQSAAGFAPDFKGSIAGVRIYSSVLTDEQIATNLSSSVSDAGLMSDVSFMSGAGDYFYDKAAATGSHSGEGIFTLTINDTYGNLVESISMNETHGYALPDYDRPGYVFVGYIVDDVLVPVGSTIDVDEDKTVIAYFVEFGTFNGGSIRLSDPTGLRFSSQINKSQYDVLISGGATVSFGTLIVKASDITVDDEIDYSLIYKNCAVKHLDITSSIQKSVGQYMQFNAAIVNIKEYNYSEKFAARAYMSITYSDSSTQIFYAGVNDNARSVSDIASLALADVCRLETNTYKNAFNGNYSKYTEAERGILNAFSVE